MHPPNDDRNDLLERRCSTMNTYLYTTHRLSFILPGGWGGSEGKLPRGSRWNGLGAPCPVHVDANIHMLSPGTHEDEDRVL